MSWTLFTQICLLGIIFSALVVWIIRWFAATLLTRRIPVIGPQGPIGPTGAPGATGMMGSSGPPCQGSCCTTDRL